MLRSKLLRLSMPNQNQLVWGILDKCPYDAQCNGAETKGGTSDAKRGKSKIEEKPPSPIPENIHLCLFMPEMSLSTVVVETISRVNTSISKRPPLIRKPLS